MHDSIGHPDWTALHCVSQHERRRHMAKKIGWVVAQAREKHTGIFLHSAVEMAGELWGWLMSTHIHLVSNYTRQLDYTGLVWGQRNGYSHTSNCKMCCVSGGPAWGDETEAIKRSIWDNQGRSQGLIQDQVLPGSLLDYVSQKLASHGMMSMCCMARELQRGVPPPYGEAFSKETLIRSACSKAFAATTQARIGETWLLPVCLYSELHTQIAEWLHWQALIATPWEMASKPHRWTKMRYSWLLSPFLMTCCLQLWKVKEVYEKFKNSRDGFCHCIGFIKENMLILDSKTPEAIFW